MLLSALCSTCGVSGTVCPQTVLVKSSLPANALPAASVCITSASGTDISMTSSTDNTQPHGDGWGSEDESESSPTDKVCRSSTLANPSYT